MSLATGDVTLKLSDLTPKWLKANYLTGISLCDADDTPYPDSFYETHLQNAVVKIERVTSITVLPREVTGEQHDYYVDDYQKFSFLQLFACPILRVDEIRMVYPLGQLIQRFPDEWIRLDHKHGQVNLVPSKGSLGQVIIGQGGDFVPLVYGGISFMPGLWECDYVAGMDKNDFPREVAEAIAKLACIDILTIASDLVRPLGITSDSLSVDGLSQSQSYQIPAFKQRIDRYIFDLYGIEGKNQELKTTSGMLKQIHDVHFGFNMASV